MKWINLLHLYQPSWQSREVLEKMFANNYEYIVSQLEQNPELKLSLNLAASLTEQLVAAGKQDWLERLRRLAAKGRIEFVGSAAYHPLLPKLTAEEISRQIKLNDEINKTYLKDEWFAAEQRHGGRGFFLPELAYSQEVGELIAKLGFKWITLSELQLAQSQSAELNETTGIIPVRDRSTGLIIVPRLKKFHPPSVTLLNQVKSDVLTITDGEIYGYSDAANAGEWSMRWEKIKPQFEFMSVGEFVNNFKPEELNLVTPSPGNWEMSKQEQKQKNYFQQWDDPKNKIHQDLWEFSSLVRRIIAAHASDKNHTYSLHSYDKSLASCTWWWAEGKFFGYNPTEISKGLNQMIETVRSISELPLKTRLNAEKKYANLIYKVWKKHWQTQA